MASTQPSSTKPDKEAPKAVLDHQLTPMERLLENHGKAILVWAGVLALLAVGWLSFSYWQRSKEIARGQALGEAKDASGLKDVIAKHEGSTAAGSAHFLLAETLWKEGKKDEAIAELRDFMSKYKDHSLYYKGVSDLGLYQVIQGNVDEGIEQLKQASAKDVPDFIRLPALLRLGDALTSKAVGIFKKSDTEGAKKVIEEASQSYKEIESAGDESLKNIAQSRLERLPHLTVAVKPAPTPPPAPPNPPTLAPAAPGEGVPQLPPAAPPPTLSTPPSGAPK